MLRSESDLTNELSNADKIVKNAYMKIRTESLIGMCSLHYAAYKHYIAEGATSTEADRLAGTVLAVLMSTDGKFLK